MTHQEETTKRGKGRPRKQEPTKLMSLRLETDLYDWLNSHKGGTSLNQYINNIIRQEARL